MADQLEKITFIPEGEETPVDFYVLEQTKLGGVTYILVTDTQEGDGEALILKDLSTEEDAEALYEIVSEDDELQADASGDVYKYFVCAICPVKAPTLKLRYDTDENFFHPSSTGHIALAPELGFLFPAFDDRAANIYNALVYSRNVELIHEEVIDAVFRVEPPMSAVEQKNVFDTALADTLEKDCSYDVVQSVHEQLRGRIQEHKESRDPAPLELTVGDVGGILSESGVSEEKVESFRRECEKQYGENAALNPKNILGTGKFEITTPEVKITVAPENSYLIEARMIGGRRYLLIPADDGVEVNGVSVNIPNEEHN